MSKLYNIGFPKCGTTYIYDNFDLPKSIYKPSYKELRSLWNDQFQFKSFADFTPYYVYYPELITKIEKGSTVFILTRPMLDRAISLFFHAQRKSIKPIDIHDILKKEKTLIDKIKKNYHISTQEKLFISQFGLLSGGCYSYWLNYWKPLKNDCNMLSISFETLNDYTSLNSFLIDKTGFSLKPYHDLKNLNFASNARSNHLNKLIYNQSATKDILKKFISPAFSKKIKRKLIDINRKKIKSNEKEKIREIVTTFINKNNLKDFICDQQTFDI